MSSNFEVALRYCGVSVLFCIVFGGYVLSVDKMIQDVPWVGWIAVRGIEILTNTLADFFSVYNAGVIHL